MRETAREAAIETAIETPIYQDQTQIVRKLGAHLSESYLAEGVGAGGAGFAVLNVPFQPAYIKCVNAAGAAPAVHDSYFPEGGTAQHTTTVLAVAANGTPPTVTRVAEGDWTVTIPVGMAPNTETLLVHIVGFRDVAASL